MKIARVFPRRTEMTPTDDLAFSKGITPLLSRTDIDEVHISVAFTYDKDDAEFMAEQLIQAGFKVKIGGPVYGDITTKFVPGMYLKKGVVITSAGCGNKCWFCKVWKRIGGLIELEVQDGYILQDDNILSCSEEHIKKVFAMLKRQKCKAEFRGGLEAKILKPWHIELLYDLQPKSMYFAYDTPDDYEPLVQAGKMLKEAGFDLRGRHNYCYCLIGYPKDTMEAAEKRMIDTLKAGFIPFAMLYKDDQGHEDKEWRRYQRLWSRPAIVVSRNKKYFNNKG
jgi:hypothetical protein